MNFQINSTLFTSDIHFNNEIIIKSFNKNYNVFYENLNLYEIISNNYKENDFILIDENVYNLDKQPFINKLDNMLLFNANEDNKNIEQVLKLCDILLEKKFTKKNKLIVIGGGITQEIGGFCACIFKRGIDWIFVPTTVLSMTDSCIGSKVSINRHSKNMLGVFTSPNKIIISDFFIKSLKPNDIISGIGESLKLCLIGGDNTFQLFKDTWVQKDYISIIKLSSLVKKVIIEHDEFEINDRKILNYGHSIGHALESTTDYFIPHGIAVLIGMYIKNLLFYDNKYEDINNLILEMVDPIFLSVQLNYTNFIKHLLNDKKNNGDTICFILLEEIGKSIIVYKKKSEIEMKLKEIFKQLFINYNE